jgi:PAS domain S-box-containing protein
VADARPHRLPGPDGRNPRLPRAAARVGATVAFAFPVLLGTEVVAVLELFGPTPAADPDDLLEVSAHIGTQLGRVVERSRASSALRRAEERFRTIFQVAGSGMLQLDHDGRIIQANRAIQEFVGRSPAQLVGRHLVELYDPEDTPAALEGFSALARGERDRDRLEVRYPRPDGSQGWLDVCTTALRDGQGRMRWAIVVAEETTRRKQVELEVRLGQKLEAVGRLAAGIAHEINTPIQFVGDNLRFLENAFADLRTLQLDYQRTVAASADRLEPATVEELRAAEAAADLGFLEEEVPGAIDQALAGVDRIATIVRAMKSFAHPPQRQRAAADLNQALRDTVMVARNQLDDVAEVELDLGELPPVVCQLGDLNQVFLNLLMNAADAVAETGRIGHITVRTRHLDDAVEVRIEDTGGGIPEAVRERVFDPFFTTKEVGRGTGQGLALAHAIVRDKHGGTLDFETEVGRGTAFTIRLPVAGAEHAGRTTARN